MTETNKPIGRSVFIVQLLLIVSNFIVAGLFFLIPVFLHAGYIAAIQPYLYTAAGMALLMSFVFLWPRRSWLWIPIVFYSALGFFFAVAQGVSFQHGCCEWVFLYVTTVVPLLGVAVLSFWLRKNSPG
jgi:hypothetical protein